MRKDFGVNTNPKTMNLNRFLPGQAKRQWLKILIALPVILILLVLGSFIWRGPLDDDQHGPLFVVRQGPLIISITESGTIQNRDQVEVKNQVEGRTTILWIIPEGTHVKKDALLVQLDDSGLQDRKIQQEATVLSAEAGYIRAKENLAITDSQGKSDIAEADLVREFAELDYDKYCKGEYLQEMQQLENNQIIAGEKRSRAQQKLEWSEKLSAEGYITDTELQADKLAFKTSQLDRELEDRKLKVFKTYTHPRNLRQLDSDKEQAAEALERVKARARADLVQADADLKAKESEFKRQETSLDKTNDQITKCRIEAPVAGMVVYSTTGKGSWRGNVEPLQEGQEVRERQDLIYLPTTASMMAEVKIHESSLRKVKPDMLVFVTCDALPDRVFKGRVGKIGLLPDAASMWLNPDLKVYSTEIYLDGNAGELQPGMTCRAEIVVAEYHDVFYVPTQSVLRVAGQPTVYVPGPGGLQQRQVELGLDNNRMVHIISGLQGGEKVALAPPLSPSVAASDTQRLREISPGRAQAKDSEKPAASQEAEPSGPAPAGGFDPAKSGQPSPEEIKKHLESLTPEQRAGLKDMRNRGERGSRSKDNKPRTED